MNLQSMDAPLIDPKTVRVMRKHLALENRKHGRALAEVPPDKWPEPWLAGNRPCQVWRSRDFLVQVFAEKSGAFRLSVCRTRIDRRGEYVDGITWDDLQTLKSQCGFSDREAIEIFPADCDVVNIHNFRHIWVVPDPIPWTWRRKS